MSIKNKEFYINFFFSIAFVIIMLEIAMMLFYRLGQANGAYRAKQDKSCVSPLILDDWKDTLEIAKTICVDVQQIQIDTIKSSYKESLSKDQIEIKRWKDNYFWCKKQLDNKK